MQASSRGRVVAVVGMGIVLALWSLPATASVITLNPAGDAFVSAGNASKNYGAAGALSVAASGLAKGEFQSYMKFDTSSAKSSFDSTYGVGQWIIQSVTLQLTAADPSNNAIFNSSAAGQFSVQWMQNDSWDEGTGKPSGPTTTGIMYNTLSSFLGAGDQAAGTFSYDGATSGQAPYDLILASGLAADLAAGSTVSLRLFPADSSVSYVLNSRNFGTPPNANEPVLSITATTPEPATLGLLAAGTLLLARGKRGKRS